MNQSRQSRAGLSPAIAVGYAIVAGVIGMGVYSYQRQTLAHNGWSELARTSPGLAPVVRPVTPALSLSPVSTPSTPASPKRRRFGGLFRPR